MNLNEYFIKVLDDLEAKYHNSAEIDRPDLQRFLRHESGDYNEGYIIEEALQRLEEIKALRVVAEFQRYYGIPLYDPWCHGCGLDGHEDLVTPDINYCPVLRPLVKAWSRGRDDIPEYLN